MMATINNVLERGVEEILPSKKGLANLMKKKKITLYQGFDPSSPSLHIGNLIGIRKLAQFQALGHKVIFLIGDFTGMIGDPTDKAAARKKLTHKQVLENAKGYKEQIKNILKFDGPNAAEIRYNYEWLSKLNFEEVIELVSNFTVQQMIERDFFQARIKAGKPIYIHELLYPLMQGYDSVIMNIDLEIGGNDQLFNMMPGRTLLKALKGKNKFILTMKLLEDPTGAKMGKTEGNAINITDSETDIFGKIMAWPDTLIKIAIELLTDLPLNFSKGKEPIEAKKALAFEVVKQIKGEASAKKAQVYFEKAFQKRALPTDIPLLEVDADRKLLVDIVAGSEIVPSRTEAKRLIKAGAVDVSSGTVSDPQAEIEIAEAGTVIKIGKSHFVRAKRQ